MPVRSVRTVAIAATVVAVLGAGAWGLSRLGSGDDDEPAASPAPTTTDTGTSTSTATTTTTGSTDSGFALDVTAGGPYQAAAGAVLRLDASVEVAGQSDTVADLEAIGAALLAYRDEHGSYPPAYLTDASGQPTVSWRVLLLPYLGEDALYEQFDLTKPWDDPANLPLVEAIPDSYHSGDSAGDTAYAGVAGAKHVFRAGAAELGGGVAPSSVVDGDTMTIAVGPVGAEVSIPWSAPEDLDTKDHPALGDPTGFDGPGELVTPLLFLDGTVRTFADDLETGTLLNWSTIAGDSCSPPASLDLELNAGWDFDTDGTVDAYGMSVEFPAGDPGEHPVELTIEDGFGGRHAVRTTVIVS